MPVGRSGCIGLTARLEAGVSQLNGLSFRCYCRAGVFLFRRQQLLLLAVRRLAQRGYLRLHLRIVGLLCRVLSVSSLVVLWTIRVRILVAFVVLAPAPLEYGYLLCVCEVGELAVAPVLSVAAGVATVDPYAVFIFVGCGGFA